MKGAFTTEGGLGGEEAVTCAALAAGKAAGRVAAEGHGELCAAGQERAWSYFLLALLDDIEAELRLGDEAWLTELLSEEKRRRQERLRQAEEAAVASGKEPFSLARLYALWPWCPDRQLSEAERARQWPRLQQEWAWSCYVEHEELRTLEAFTFRLRELQRQGLVDS